MATSPKRAVGEDARAPASRARAKLEAALACFALDPHVAGARALDVGTGAGGFAEVLLARGARAVTAIDVGHGQMRTHLRDDRRVELFEKVDFRRLPLRLAPGPFDFFVVDVSFVAGRSMLRGLAFRLRPGARGVVLLKPQLELPARTNARADDPARRRARAIERFAAKAARQGFAVLETCDSPVAGRAGSIEVLVHLQLQPAAQTLRSDEPATPPPRERTEDAPRRDRLEWFAVVPPGGEGAAARELERLAGVRSVQPTPGGVTFTGDLALGARANLWLRIPTRILLRLGSVRAREFAELRRRAARLPWREHLAPDTATCLRISQRGSRLYHTGAIADSLALALRDALGPGARASVSPRDAPGAQQVFVRGERDRFTFSLDASGERLHRRGWRLETGRAPLRETFAALVLELCGWREDEPLIDPLCGAGTFAIEAACRALAIAPGLGRDFVCERWRGAATMDWPALRAEAERARRTPTAISIAASDRSSDAVARAQRNAERAGCASAIRFFCTALDAFEPPGPPGLVVLNPPYGRRLGEPSRLPGLYDAIGHHLRTRFAAWRVGILIPDRALEPRLRLPVIERHTLRNGGLAVTLLVCAALRTA